MNHLAALAIYGFISNKFYQSEAGTTPDQCNNKSASNYGINDTSGWF